MIWYVSLTLEATNDALICFDPKLGVPTNADDIALKRAYRKQAMKVCGNFDSAFYRCSHMSSNGIQYHPDKNPSVDAEEKFKEIRSAPMFLNVLWHF